MIDSILRAGSRYNTRQMPIGAVTNGSDPSIAFPIKPPYGHLSALDLFGVRGAGGYILRQIGSVACSPPPRGRGARSPGCSSGLPGYLPVLAGIVTNGRAWYSSAAATALHALRQVDRRRSCGCGSWPDDRNTDDQDLAANGKHVRSALSRWSSGRTHSRLVAVCTSREGLGWSSSLAESFSRRGRRSEPSIDVDRCSSRDTETRASSFTVSAPELSRGRRAARS